MQHPADRDLLSSIFRTIYTIKGTLSFLGLTTSESITHRAENILSQLRDGERRLTPVLMTLLLETVDVVKKILAEIEATESEGSETYDHPRLPAACEGQDPDEEAPSHPTAKPARVTAATAGRCRAKKPKSRRKTRPSQDAPQASKGEENVACHQAPSGPAS